MSQFILQDADIHQLFARADGYFDGGFPIIPSSIFSAPKGTEYFKTPGVSLVAKPLVNLYGMTPLLDTLKGAGSYLLDETPLSDGVALIKAAGQGCYLSYGESRTRNAEAKQYINRLLSEGHGSVFEHANFTFLLYGISRSLSHELVRHRAGFAYSQASQRYVSTVRFVERPEFQHNTLLHIQFENFIDGTAQKYQQMIHLLRDENDVAGTQGRKKVQQSARFSLPNGTETSLTVTANVRAWRHFLEARCSKHAEPEIRKLAWFIYLCLWETEPLLFGDYVIEEFEEKEYTLSTPYRKV